jgi:beta-phosphoglucomutase family hydrolase
MADSEERMNRDDLPGEAVASQAALRLPSTIRACLFDMDGVLTQTAKLHCAAWKQIFDEYLRKRSLATGEPFAPFDAASDFEQRVDGRLRVDGVRSFLASRSIHLPDGEETDSSDAETASGLAQRKDEIFVHLLKHEGAETFVGSVRYVNAVRQAGLAAAVVSSSKHCRDVLASAGISDLFDARIDGVVASENHLAGKPAPDTYLAAARALRVTPAEAAVFEDAVSGIEAGRAGRFGFVVGVDRVGQAAQLRRHGADIVVNDLAALLGGA